ncbi:glutamine-hydrolyzing asparagine synthase [Rhizoclosmatium globosum]|uniref:Glutamine-hydrolyzing asparagine synthase n=1 Tax=Rhizoclosmatium globosum TaxID=329046 RepID=A0A1Y2D292_9FUNG|nr:glutamine-hydrolyzing asparagine synthase [Rhizoclosmatium globosum]|eukprot:ORY53409.1 glutamine-hydrolyzing asparagine synthase [Rhizoclosmatium globosum]
MCGIVAFGLIDSSVACQSKGPGEAELKAALDLVKHRGPDGHGIWLAPDNGVGLGHVRLSIMDVEGGHQPIFDQDENVYAVVNGELYEFESIREKLIAVGHKFKTGSDSEIVLHLYLEHGLAMFDHLIGEFSFAIYDKRSFTLIVARDRFGVKPVFYTVVNGRLLVASEAKSFLALGWEPEWDISSVVNSGIFVDNRTLFKGVSKLPPASYLILSSSGTMSISQYWQPEYVDRSLKDDRSEEDMILNVQQHLVQAVRCRLRADVPVAVYLSGGIDSSAVLGIASQIARQSNPDAVIDTFTIGFKGRAVDSFDESEVAQRAADYCGEGADEHFAGYPFFIPDALRAPNATNLSESDRMNRLNAVEAKCKMLANLGLQDRLSEHDEQKAKELVGGISTVKTLSLAIEMPRTLFTSDALQVTGNPDACRTLAESVGGVLAARCRSSSYHPLHAALLVETRSLLPNYLCNHLGDRSEMSHSIEGRVPFLDHRLTDYVNGLPPHVKIRFDPKSPMPVEKWILRQAVKPFVSMELLHRPKVPFLAPPALLDPNSKHCSKIKRVLTRQAIEQLGWANWQIVKAKMDDAFATNNRMSQNFVNCMMSFVVIIQGEKVGLTSK